MNLSPGVAASSGRGRHAVNGRQANADGALQVVAGTALAGSWVRRFLTGAMRSSPEGEAH